MIEIDHIYKKFGAFQALKDVSLSVQPGELVALLGPSGSGKTTLLRIIAGLDFADTGSISFSGTDATTLHARDRNVGFVFQHYALFRHMTVFDNVAFGLTVRKPRPSREAIAEKVHSLLQLVQLDGLADRYPSQLSGGQRQRVALARALAIEPKILLLDEPFGALDAQVRKDLRRWLRRLHDDLGLTGVFVTHDQEEALEVADRVVVMNKGRIEQVGTPSDVYDHPATPFVHGFLGHATPLPVGKNGELIYVRPHDIHIFPAGTADTVPAIVRHSVVLGPTVRLELEVDRIGPVEAEASRREIPETLVPRGTVVGLRFPSASAELAVGA